MASLSLFMAKVTSYAMIRKYLKFIATVLYSNIATLKRPYKLTFVLTKKCNSRCLNCNIWQDKDPHELDLKQIEDIAKRNNYFKWIDFTGGEVSLRPDFVDIVELFHLHCKDLLYVHFPTNGLKPQIIEEMTTKLSALNVKVVVTVSLDGPQKLNDHLRGVRGDFKNSIDTYKRLREIRNVHLIKALSKKQLSPSKMK
jgi:MoaA/NifB/PqqE/SkfB family radical SAM enzyme